MHKWTVNNVSFIFRVVHSRLLIFKRGKTATCTQNVNFRLFSFGFCLQLICFISILQKKYQCKMYMHDMKDFYNLYTQYLKIFFILFCRALCALETDVGEPTFTNNITRFSQINEPCQTNGEIHAWTFIPGICWRMFTNCWT